MVQRRTKIWIHAFTKCISYLSNYAKKHKFNFQVRKHLWLNTYLKVRRISKKKRKEGKKTKRIEITHLALKKSSSSGKYL